MRIFKLKTQNKRALRKGKKMKMPLKHQITKIHKELVISILFFVSFCVFVTLWQKKDFSERTQIMNSEEKLSVYRQ